MLVGISQQSLAYCETSLRNPSVEVAYKLANVLDTSIDYLMGRDEYSNKYYNLNNTDKDTINRMVDSLSNKNNN